MKNIKYLITLTFLLMAFIVTDYCMFFYGKGFNLLNQELTFGYNTDFDNLEYFKIEYEDFDQIIGYGTQINSNISVNRVLEYSFNDSGIYCYIIDNYKQKHFVKIDFDANRKMGQKIVYQLLSDKPITNSTWFNVNNPLNVFILHFVRLLTVLTIIFVTLKKFIFKKW